MGTSAYIHLKPALQEFVVCAFLDGSRRVSAADTFGKLIKPWLTTPPEGFNPIAPGGAGIFEFELPAYDDKNTAYNFYIAPKAQKYIATMLHEMFLTLMFIHLDKILPRMEREQIKDAIYDYCYSYNISMEHIQYDTLKKAYYRYRKKKHKKKSSGFVPVLSLLILPTTFI
jgi:hypothetical protein